jgi:hypothetical protein
MPGRQMHCDERVQYFEFKGPLRGLRGVNASERAAAGRMRCSVENSDVAREALMFSISPHLVSTAVSELEYCRTCGGGCHGHTVLATYDGKTGRALRIADVLKPDAVEPLRRHIADYIAKTYVDEPGRDAYRQRLAQSLVERPFADDGVYAENGILYVNLDSFVLSCAEGSFFPVPIPKELIAPSFAALLN